MKSACCLLSACALLLPAFASPAWALSDTTQFNVTITIQEDCNFTTATTLDFGTQGALSAAVNASSTLSVQCTPTTDYTIALDAGDGAGATIPARLMTGPASATVEYTLYQDMAHSILWGDGVSGSLLNGVGNGMTQSYDVYGVVPSQTTPAAGTYTDTITATLTF